MNGRQWALVLAASVAAGVVWLSVSEITVALPAIQRDLDASLGELQWISSVSFTLTLTALLIAGGRLGDLRGHRKVLGLGLLVFAASSVVCAIVPNAVVLIIARGGQGVGAAMLLTTSLALIANTIPSRVRGLAVGVYGAIATIMQGGGPLLGGAFTSLGVWQLVFWANLPIALLVWIALVRTAKDSVEPGAPRSLDVTGILTGAAAAGSLTLVLINGSSWGWGSVASIACFAATVIAGAAWVVRERRARAPLVPLRLFANPLFSGAVFLLFAANLAIVTQMFFLALYFQYLLDFSAFMAGVLFLPIAAVSVVAGPGFGRMFDRRGPRLPNTAAIALAGAGAVGIAAAVLGDSYWLVFPGLVVFGIGAAGVAAAAGTSVVQAVPADTEGAAAGVFAVGATLASTLGLALAGPIFAETSQDAFDRDVASAGIQVQTEPGEVTAILSDSPAGREAVSSAPPDRRAEVQDIAAEAFRDGAFITLLVFAAVCVLGVAVAILTQRARWIHPRNVTAEVQERGPPEPEPTTA